MPFRLFINYTQKPGQASRPWPRTGKSVRSRNSASSAENPPPGLWIWACNTPEKGVATGWVGSGFPQGFCEEKVKKNFL